MAKTHLWLAPLVGYLSVACPSSPAAAGWDAYAVYGSPTVVLYAQYPAGRVRWRVYPRYYQTLYWPAGYRYQADHPRRPPWTGCGC
jgi:hypothetical protein